MKCSQHIDVDAVGICARCDRPVCSACARTGSGRTYCPACDEWFAHRQAQRSPATPSVPPAAPPPPRGAAQAAPKPEPAAQGRMDIGDCLSFIKREEHWMQPLLLGSLAALLSLVFIGIPLLLGYGAQVLRRSAASDPSPLPDWSDWGGLLGEGFRVVGVLLVHYLMAGALLALPWGAVFALAAVTGERNDEMSALAALAVLGAYALTLLVGFLLAVYLAAPLVRVVVLDRFGAVFEFAENVAFIRRNLANYFMALLAAIVANLISQFGILLCCVGLVPASFWALCVYWYSFGQVVRFDPVLSQRVGWRWMTAGAP